MKRKMKLILFAMFFLLIILPVFAYNLNTRGLWSDPPTPTLISPTKETVDLSGKDSLEFKWRITSFTNMESYDFRLYKGYATAQESLMVKQTVDGDTDFVKISADLFQDGQVYTWVLRGTFDSGQKTDRASSSFRVIKK